MSAPTAGEPRGLSRPLIELIELPSPEQCRTLVLLLGLLPVVQERLDSDRVTTGEVA